VPTTTPAQEVVTRRGVREYTGNHQLHTYDDVSGLRLVPRTCGPPKVVRVHADYGLRTIGWTAARNGRPPVVPKPEDIVIASSDGSFSLTTDTYLGGTVNLPLPQINERQGGYDWEVAGSYQFLQTTNRKMGTHPMPTGGFPHQVFPNDALAAKYLLDHGIQVVLSPGSDENPEAEAIRQIAEKLVNHEQTYPWPFTTLPAQTVTSGLLGG
jgi:hypothetical protein